MTEAADGVREADEEREDTERIQSEATEETERDRICELRERARAYADRYSSCGGDCEAGTTVAAVLL